MISSSFIRKSKPVILMALLIPSFIWIGLFISGDLGVNPIDILMDNLGEMGLRLLIVVLIVSSLSEISYFRSLQTIRRTIGLVSFYYIFLHLICYIFLDHFFNFKFILNDILKRPFITFGFFGFILLLPLVFTSKDSIIKKLTFKIWKKIHYLIYLVILLGILHFYLLTKANKTEPLIYLGVLFVLFFVRIYKIFIRRGVLR